MIVGSCVNFSAYSRLSVGLKDTVDTLTGDATTLCRLRVESFEYLRVLKANAQLSLTDVRL